MHDFLKKIFGTSKPAPQAITFDAVPGWLTEKESAARAALKSGSKEPMDAIRQAIAHLQLIMNEIFGAEHDPEIHPKLKTIAKNSLPQFVRAMKGSLSKELPDDPEEFYTAAAECVKSCLHTAHGQGRYLQAIFPEEMKGVRQGIDAIGRSINTLNPLLAAYRKETAEVVSALSLFESIEDLAADYRKSEEKIRRVQVRIAEITERCTAIENEEKALSQDPRMHEIDGEKSAIADLARQRDDAARTYSALSMTSSHVFRKAEKIATRQRHPAEIYILNAAMEILSDHDIPDRERLDAALLAACPVAERMIADGEVVLKNKEERMVFSDTVRFRSDIGIASVSLREREEQCTQAEAALSTHPLIMKTQSLEREKKQILAMLSKENNAREDLEAWRSKTEKHLPDLVTGLKKKIVDMSGDNVQLQTDDQMLS